MDLHALLLELYGRIPPLARGAVEGVPLEDLTRPPAPGANTIAWLVWHMARVEDSHIAELLEEPQLWETGDWAGHFGLAPDPRNSGYGHTEAEVLAIRPDSAEVLVGHLEAVAARTRTFLTGLGPDDLDRIVDRRWDPPVTMGVRLVSIADDGLQHGGQAGYARGLLGH